MAAKSLSNVSWRPWSSVVSSLRALANNGATRALCCHFEFVVFMCSFVHRLIYSNLAMLQCNSRILRVCFESIPHNVAALCRYFFSELLGVLILVEFAITSTS